MKKKESIFKLLMQKPWDPAQVKVDNLHEGSTLDLSKGKLGLRYICLLYTSPSPRDGLLSRMPSSA